MNGNKKCNEQKKVIVGRETHRLPHNQQTTLILITLNNPVITVAPHKDICPIGRT